MTGDVLFYWVFDIQTSRCRRHTASLWNSTNTSVLQWVRTWTLSVEAWSVCLLLKYLIMCSLPKLCLLVWIFFRYLNLLKHLWCSWMDGHYGFVRDHIYLTRKLGWIFQIFQPLHAAFIGKLTCVVDMFLSKRCQYSCAGYTFSTLISVRFLVKCLFYQTKNVIDVVYENASIHMFSCVLI